MSPLRLYPRSLPQILCGLATLGLLSALTVVVSDAQDNQPAVAAPAVSAASPAASAPAAASASASATATTPAASGARRGARASGTAARGSAAPAAPVATIPRDGQPFVPNNFRAVDPKLPTLVIAGDSTAQTGSNAMRGWGAVLNDYFDPSKINLVNPSIGGRSFRTFYHEGRWDQVVAGLKPGDIVMIQFGHNDGGDIHNANGRADIAGDGDQTETVTLANGATEVVHTLGWYLRTFIADVKAKGATPVVMAATPYNRSWANHAPGDLSAVQVKIAEELKVLYLNHTEIISEHYDVLGQAAVRPLFNNDGLHTTTLGAIVNAEMFVAGIKAMEIKTLTDALNDKGKAIPAYKPAPAKPAAASGSAPATGSPPTGGASAPASSAATSQPRAASGSAN